MPGVPHGPDPRPPGGMQRPVPGCSEPAAEGRGPAGARCGAPDPARGGTGEAEGAPVMERRTFLAMIPGGLLAAPLAAEAQPAGSVPRIGYLGFAPSGTVEGPESFRQALRELGRGDGQNITMS